MSDFTDANALAEAILRDQQELRDRIIQALRDAAMICHSLAAEKSAEIVSQSDGANGRFLQSWSVTELDNGAELVNDAPYAGIIEEGSRPHWPPFRPIFDYMGRVMGIPTAGVPSGSKYDLSDVPIFKAEPALEKLRQAAYSVALAISLGGTKPRHILAGLQQVFDEVVRERLDQAVQ
ncbi:hypothetical protein GC173_11565 [bacterium]|nr:hypothetical protein [bacterium]